MKRKKLFRWVIFLGILWIFTLILLYVSRFGYNDKALALLKNYLDQQLAIEIHIRKDDVHFSLLKKFPFASIELNNILIKSSGSINLNESLFIPDTLLYAKNVSFVLGLKGLLTSKYELKRIDISDGQCNLLCDKSGRVNYRILKSKSEYKKSDSVLIKISKINIERINFSYLNQKNNFMLSADIKKAEIEGNFHSDSYTLKAHLNALNSIFKVNNKDYLRKMPLEAAIQIKKENDQLYFEKGRINVAGIISYFNGNYDKSSQAYSLTLHGNSLPVSKLKHPIVDEYIQKSGFKIQKGTLKYQLKIFGSSVQKPTIQCQYSLIDCFLKNKKHNIPVQHLYANGQINNGKYKSSSSSILTIDTLRAISNQNKIAFKGYLANFKDPFLSGNVTGTQDLSFFNDLYRSKLSSSGFANYTFLFNFKLSAFKSDSKVVIDKMPVSGSVVFNNAQLSILNQQYSPFSFSGQVLFETLSNIRIENLDIAAKSTKLNLTGDIRDFSFSKNINANYPTFTLNINADYINIEDFISKNEKHSKNTGISFPDSLFLNAKFLAGSLTFGKFMADNIECYAHYSNEDLKVKVLSMESQGGRLQGDLQISETGEKINGYCQAYLNKVDIRELFIAFNNFNQNIIGSDNLDGKLTGSVNFSGVWNLNLQLIKNQLKLNSEIQIDNGELINYQPMLGLSKFIEIDELKHIKFNQLNININISDEIVYIAQTQINSTAISLSGSGSHAFDNRYSYHLQVMLSDLLWKKAKKKKPENNEFGYVIDDGLGKTTLPLVINGKGDEFEVHYDKKQASRIVRQKLKEEKEELKKLFNADKDTINSSEEYRIKLEDTRSDDTENVGNENSETDQEFIIEWEDD
ncbi:MAG: hypothetical protein JW894_08845 [Bacteroidales bacterium]|nr:hypothetical protein [Bacteroidales bacterium]